jgi:hypothetical protein
MLSRFGILYQEKSGNPAWVRFLQWLMSLNIGIPTCVIPQYVEQGDEIIFEIITQNVSQPIFGQN